MKYKTIINKKSIYKCYFMIDTALHMLRNIAIVVLLVLSLQSYVNNDIVFAGTYAFSVVLAVIEINVIRRIRSKRMIERIEDIYHTDDLQGEVVLENQGIRYCMCFNITPEVNIEYSEFKEIRFMKNYCIWIKRGNKEKKEIDGFLILNLTATNASEIDDLKTFVQRKMPQVKLRGIRKKSEV